MAPEQWNGDAITAATDQFAYCVALWEALSGERPYRGANLAELSAQVACGPEALDASRIPRRFRGLLRRGLETDPARRWPSMEALLAGLVRAERRPAAAAAIAATAGLAAAVLVVALRASAAPSPACEPPARDPAAVWSPVVAAITRGSTSRAHEAVLDAAFRDWQATRDRACSAPPQVRHEQLRCLDQVLARFEVVRQAFTQVPGVAAEAIQGELVEPVVCRNPEPSKVPRLTLAPSRDVLRAYALYARSTTDDKPGEAEIVSAIDDPETQACARVIATLALAASSTNLPRVRSRMGDAVALADRCQDDRLRADLMIRDSPYHWELPMIGPRGENAIRQAENAAARVMQPGLEAALALQRLTVAARRGEWDRAFELAAQAFSGYRTRGLRLGQLRAVIARNHLRLVRAEPGDVEAIGGDVQQWRPLAVASHQPELARELDVLDGMARFRLGDVAAAHAELVQAWRAQHRTAPLASARRITGEVVDARGHPVPGATVAAAPSLSADSTGIGLPVFFAYEHYRDPLLRSTTSDASGRFVIEDVLPGSVIAAMRGDEGTRPRAIAERVTLVLEPTRTISGTVDLGRISHTRAQIEGEADRDPNDSFTFVAPVAPDGSFTIRGVPTGAVRIGVAMRDHGEFDQHVAYREIPASPTSVTGVRLEASLSPRTLDVIVRSTVSAPVEGAMVRVFAGKHSITSFDDLVRLKFVALQISLATPASERRAPEPVQDRVRPGDLVAHLEHALLGELTVCVTGLGGDLLDPAYLENTAAHLPQLAIRCAPVSADARVVELAVPPQPRFE
ncbi:MAG TPA: protein kinase, partial [Kofleriaceae bacterium]|nr:protein kinase [Kofleriaceae bacterium]